MILKEIGGAYIVTPFEIIERLIVCISPIVVAWFAWRSSVSQKRTKEFLELQTKYNAELEATKKREADAQHAAMEKMSDDIAKLESKVDTLVNSLDLEEINGQLKNILELSNINFDYSQSLSQVICAIGDCVERSSIGNTSVVADELAKHKVKEREITGRLVKILY